MSLEHSPARSGVLRFTGAKNCSSCSGLARRRYTPGLLEPNPRPIISVPIPSLMVAVGADAYYRSAPENANGLCAMRE